VDFVLCIQECLLFVAGVLGGHAGARAARLMNVDVAGCLLLGRCLVEGVPPWLLVSLSPHQPAVSGQCVSAPKTRIACWDLPSPSPEGAVNTM
jgi:hypothetical protein